MNQSRSLSDLTVTELRKVLQIKEEIASLETQLKSVLGASAVVTTTNAPRRGRPPGKGKRQKMSPEARARIAAAQRARWAAQKGGKAAKPAKVAKVKGKRGRRKLSAEARERIAVAQRARWAARRGTKPAAAAPAPAKKRGGRRKLSPEARERIAAAQRARWAAVRKAK